MSTRKQNHSMNLKSHNSPDVIARPLTEFDERVLQLITTSRPDGIPFFSIMPNYLDGEEISQSLQKLKRRGLAVVAIRRGTSRWRATKRPND